MRLLSAKLDDQAQAHMANQERPVTLHMTDYRITPTSSMRTLIFLAVVFSLISLANAATVDATINECSKENDHPRVSQCVFDRATSARRELDATERAMRVRIEKSSEDVSYLKPIQQRFEASVSSYQRYRGEQCGLHQALSNLSVYTEEIMLACEAMLDSDRVQQLKRGMHWLE
jgi:hypothetical protein